VSAETKPVPFVVGVGRSGTTLLRLMLDAHPEVAIPPETHFLPDLIARFAADDPPTSDELVLSVQTHPGWRDFGLEPEEMRASFATAEPGAGGAIRAFYAAYAARHQKPRWGDKTPVYVEHMALIEGALGEQARFIHLIRDGRDVAVSRRARAAKRGREPTPAAEEAETWRRRILDARAQSAEVAHYLELRYEDLVADPEAALRRVCAEIDLGFDPAMLDYHRSASERLAELSDLPGKGGKVRPSSERIAAHALTSEPPQADRSGRWRTELTRSEIAAYEDVAGGLLADLGYPVGG
jgi:hypothetical protein